MKRLLLAALLFSSASFAGVEVEAKVDTRYQYDIAFGTQCIGGFLFAFAIKGDNSGSISIQQIFEDGRYMHKNTPIKCEATK